MLKLYQFPRPKSFPNFSPFCVKIETYLRMAEIPYENVFTLDLGKNPKKLMPYIELDGEIIGDSALIIDCLINKYGDKIDYWLNKEQKAISMAFIALLENHLIPFGLYFRWEDKQGWLQFRDLLFGKMPKLLKILIGNKIAKKFRTRLNLQGISRFSISEMLHLVEKDLQVLSEYLADKPFFFGERPTLIDIVLFAVYGNLAIISVNTKLKDLALNPQFTNLYQHSKRMLEMYYK